MKLRTNAVIEFPDVCILKASYRPTLTQPKKYLGDKAEHDRRNRFTITIALKDDKQRREFLRWWTVDLEYGIFPFYITLPIFGKDYKIQVQLINDLSSMETNELLESTLELEQIGYIAADGIVLDDITVAGANSCTIPMSGTTCNIENTLTSNISGTPIGTMNYVWTVTGATIKSGQGTNSIVIDSDNGNLTDSVNATLKINDDVHTDTMSKTIQHTRTHESTIPCPELIPNGEFTHDISGVYVEGDPADISWSNVGNGELKVARGAGVGDRDAWIKIKNMIVGRKYEITANQGVSSNNWNTISFNSPQQTQVHVFAGQGSSDIHPNFEWVATATTGYIRFRVMDGVNDLFTIPSVSAKCKTATQPSDKPYLEDVTIPPYDSGNSEHFLIDTIPKLTASNLNNTNYKHFYIVPNDYTPQGRIVITESGTASENRTISLHNGNDTHPASLNLSERALYDVRLDNASYWVFDRICPTKTAFTDTMISGNILFDRGSSHNIINRMYHVGGYTTLRIKKNASYNTLQKSFIDTPNPIMWTLDDSTVMLQDWAGVSPMVHNKFILNEFRDMRPFKFHDEEGNVNEPEFTGCIVDSNVIWWEDSSHCDSDGTPNPSGKYSLTECSAVGVKEASHDINKPLIISNNACWGGLPSFPDSVNLSAPAPQLAIVYVNSHYVNLENNITIGMPNSTSLILNSDAENNTGCKMINNISYKCGNTPESQTAQSAGIRMQGSQDGYVKGNLIKDPRGAWAMVQGCHTNNYMGENTIINKDLDFLYGSNWEDVTGLKPTDTNIYLTSAEGDTQYPHDYTIHYMKYTTTPKTKVIPKVLKTIQSV